MGFIRVRQVRGPAHEFDISEAAYRSNPGGYKVLDKTPVAKPRPVKHVQAEPAKSVVKSAWKEQ